MEHKKFMTLALSEAQKAKEKGEIPVGAVIVKNSEVIAKAHNLTEEKNSPLAHAELLALTKALQNENVKYLSDCTLYVTLEPCPMCMGAILHSRVERIVFGAYDEKTGCSGSKADFSEFSFFRKPQILGGYMEKESREMLTEFFRELR